MATASKPVERSVFLADYVQDVPYFDGRVRATPMYLYVGRCMLHSTRYRVGKLSIRVDTLCQWGNERIPPVVPLPAGRSR